LDQSMALDRIGEILDRYGRELLEDPDRLQHLLEGEWGAGREWFFPFVMAVRTAREVGYSMPLSSPMGAVVADAMVDRFGIDPETARWASSGLVLLSRRHYGSSSEVTRSRVVDLEGVPRRRPMLSPSQILWAVMGLLWFFAALSFGVYRMLADRRPEGGEFRVTLMAPLTGPGGPAGQAMLRAGQLAVEQVNAQGGIRGYRVRLLGFDSFAPDGAGAAEMADRMKAKTRPHVVVAAVGDAGALELVNWSQSTLTPVIALDAKDPKVPAVSPYKPNPFMFALLAGPNVEGRSLAHLVSRGLNRRRVLLVFDGGSSRSVEAQRRFESAFPAAGGEVANRFDVSQGSLDQLQRVLDEAALAESDSAVVALVFDHRLVDLARILRLRFRGPLVGLGLPREAHLEAFRNSWWLDDLAPGDVYVQPFVVAYRQRYKEQLPRDLVAPAVLSYDGVRWAADAISRASSYRPEGIRYALADTRSVPLVHATLTIDPSIHAPSSKAMALIYVGDRGPAFQRRIWVRGR